LLETAFRPLSRGKDLPPQQSTTMTRKAKIRTLRTARFVKSNFFDLLICVTIALVLVLLSSGAAFAQNVGINNPTPHDKALLDLTSNDKGVLVPRMTAAQRTAMFPVADATARGMLVYQTNGTQGFYYFDGNVWIHMEPNANTAGWELDGNAGTDPANDFVGTTDAQPLVVRTNSVERMRVGENGNVSIGASLTPSNYRLFVENNTTNAGVLVRNANPAGRAGINAVSDANATAQFGVGNSGAGLLSGVGFTGTGSANDFALLTNNAERVRVTQTGNVGIGTVAPQARLDVTLNSTIAQPQLRLSEIGNDFARVAFHNDQTAKFWQIAGLPHANDDQMALNFFHSDNQNLMSIRGNGNVGIGTVAPAHGLHVVRTTDNATLGLRNMNNDAVGGVNYYGSAGSLGGVTGWSNGGNAFAPHSLVHGTLTNMPATFITNSTERMRIMANGNVGIGNTAPVSKLHVRLNDPGYAPNPGSGFTVENTGNVYANLLSANAETGLLFGANGNAQSGGIVYNNPAIPNGLMFRVNGNQTKLIMTDQGNVGISNGIAYTNYRLFVGSDQVTASMMVQNSNAAGVSGVDFFNAAGTAQTIMGMGNGASAFANVGYAGTGSAHPFVLATGGMERMRITANGNVGLGTNATNVRLQVEADQADVVSNFRNTNAAGWSGIHFDNSTGNARTHIGFGNASSGMWANMGYTGTTSSHPFVLTTNNLERMRIAANGNVGIGTAAPTTKLEVNGFTKLGDDAPAIKVKKLTGTTAATEGGLVDIPHGVPAAKILGIQVLIQYGASSWVGEAYTHAPEYQAHALVMGPNIRILNHATNSGNILNRAVKILVTYEE